jgi:Tfp pilus assembly protein PilZ
VRTVLDLVQEFARLQEERWRSGGALLPAAREERWQELAAFCHRVLTVGGAEAARRERDWTRASLRVPADVDMIFQHRGEYYSGQLVNLSRGGIFLGSTVLLPTGSPLVLLFSNLGREPLLEARGEVVWTHDRNRGPANLPRGMGVRFVESDSIARQLEGFVFETLERRLVGLDLALLDRL